LITVELCSGRTEGIALPDAGSGYESEEWDTTTAHSSEKNDSLLRLPDIEHPPISVVELNMIDQYI